MEAEGAAGKADIRIKLRCQGMPHKIEILKARVKALLQTCAWNTNPLCVRRQQTCGHEAICCKHACFSSFLPHGDYECRMRATD